MYFIFPNYVNMFHYTSELNKWHTSCRHKCVLEIGMAEWAQFVVQQVTSDEVSQFVGHVSSVNARSVDMLCMYVWEMKRVTLDKHSLGTNSTHSTV